MTTHPVGRLLLALLIVAGVTGCDPDSPSQRHGFGQCMTQFSAIADAVSTDTGYRIDYADVLGSHTRLHISIFNPKLETADQATREQAATAIVAAAERVLAAYPACRSIRTITLGIYHPSGMQGPVHEWHMEDVVEFRKGSDNRFSVFVPSEAPRRTP